MKEKKRIPTDGEPVAWKSPFAGLKDLELSPTQPGGKTDRPTAASSTHVKHRGRVDILRQTAHRGGKTVTVVTGFVAMGQTEKEQLAKEMQKACGVGGTVKDGRIEIQGDKREEVARILAKAGFRPVFAGG
ncbi:MAG: translation initiation factor [Nitrospira sp.]|nr:translation initiation factor [Nitrospira sp.]